MNHASNAWFSGIQRADGVLPSALLQESHAELAPAGANKVQSIFAGGVYVGKNTSRLANVRIVRRERTMRALPRAAAFSNESPTKWVSFESLSKILF